MAVSPFAKRAFVDHTPHDTTSILMLIEARFGIAPLTAKAINVLGGFQF